jgi:hypothetical protein
LNSLKQVSRNSSKRNGPIAINATSLRPNQTAAWNDAEALRNLQVVEVDPLLIPHVHHLRYRFQEFLRQRSAIDKHEGGLEVFSRGQYPVRNANVSLFLQVQDFCSRTQSYTGHFFDSQVWYGFGEKSGTVPLHSEVQEISSRFRVVHFQLDNLQDQCLTFVCCACAGYEKFGFTREKNCIVYREWAPAAQ